MYADVELLLGTWITTQTGIRCLNVLPADLIGDVPLVQVVRYGGADDNLTLDEAAVDIDCYTTDRTASFQLAEQVRSAVRLRLPGYHTAAGTVADVQTVVGPSWRPYDNTNVCRVGASYRVTVHSVP